MDYVEVPSHLMEYFAFDYRVLRLFAKHHITGETIPEHLVQTIRKSRSMFSAIDMQTQVQSAAPCAILAVCSSFCSRSFTLGSIVANSVVDSTLSNANVGANLRICFNCMTTRICRWVQT